MADENEDGGDYWNNDNWNNYPYEDENNEDNNDNHNDNNDENDDNQNNPTINTMTYAEVNNFDVKNDSHMNLIYRRMISGQCFRLPNTPTCPDDVFESWIATFLTESSDDPEGKCRSFRFAWAQDRKGDQDVPIVRFLCAQGIVELCSIASNYISRTNIRLENGDMPSATNWKETLKLTIFTPLKIDANAGAGIPAAIPATPDKYLLVLDGIIHYLTGGFYKNVTGKGFATQKYFSEYDENYKILKMAYKTGTETLVIDMLPSFKEGTYHDYTAIVAAVKRRYRRGHTQETMIDWFRKLDEAMTNKCPTEFKIQRLRTLITAKFITDPDKFPTCSDFEGDSIVQTHPEEFSPIIATLLHYITLSSEIPRSEWDKIQRLFSLEIKGKATYMSWHENRSELYRVIDEYKSNNKNISHVDQQDINAIRRGQFRPNRGRGFRPNQQRTNNYNNNTRFSQNRPPVYRPPQQRQNMNFRPRPPPQRSFKNNRPPPGADSNENRLRRLLCMHCSRWAGKNKYHQGPWGGGPSSNCPYDKSGRIRPGYRFLGRIYGQDVNSIQVESFHDIEADGLEYEEPAVNQISDTDNFLIARAMGNHD